MLMGEVSFWIIKPKLGRSFSIKVEFLVISRETEKRKEDQEVEPETLKSYKILDSMEFRSGKKVTNTIKNDLAKI